MENSYVLCQKIENLETDLKELRKKEAYTKENYEKVINSLLLINSCSNKEDLKIEKLRKKHSNDILLLKYFFKQRLNLLEKRLIEEKERGENGKIEFEKERNGFERKIRELEMEKSKSFEGAKEFEKISQDLLRKNFKIEVQRAEIMRLTRQRDELIREISMVQQENSNDFQNPFQFSSPGTIKAQLNHSTSCKKQEKLTKRPPVHSPTHSRAHSLAYRQNTPFTIPLSNKTSPQRHSLIEISDNSLENHEKSFTKIPKNSENCTSNLKILISKLKNQRDKVKIDNEKMLIELKEAKLTLAVEKEKNCEKLNKIENEFKKFGILMKNILEERNSVENIREKIFFLLRNTMKLI